MGGNELCYNRLTYNISKGVKGYQDDSVAYKDLPFEARENIAMENK
jgi:hypothetical protein